MLQNIYPLRKVSHLKRSSGINVPSLHNRAKTIAIGQFGLKIRIQMNTQIDEKVMIIFFEISIFLLKISFQLNYKDYNMCIVF